MVLLHSMVIYQSGRQARSPPCDTVRFTILYHSCILYFCNVIFFMLTRICWFLFFSYMWLSCIVHVLFTVLLCFQVFSGIGSAFNSDLSKWQTDRVTDMEGRTYIKSRIQLFYLLHFILFTYADKRNFFFYTIYYSQKTMVWLILFWQCLMWLPHSMEICQSGRQQKSPLCFQHLAALTLSMEIYQSGRQIKLPPCKTCFRELTYSMVICLNGRRAGSPTCTPVSEKKDLFS